MSELALDDVDVHPLSSELDRVRVPQLMRREPAAHAGLRGKRSELSTDGGRGPRATTCLPVDDAEQRPDRKLDAVLEPAFEVLKPSRIRRP